MFEAPPLYTINPEVLCLHTLATLALRLKNIKNEVCFLRARIPPKPAKRGQQESLETELWGVSWPLHPEQISLRLGDRGPGQF